MRKEDIAVICHEVNSAYCRAIGDPVAHLTQELQDSIVDGIDFLEKNPGATPEDSHKNWMAHKLANGWEYGEEKSEADKIHPCLVEYEELAVEQRTKDDLFMAVVNGCKQVKEDDKEVSVNSTEMTPVKYIGHRPVYTDGVYGTKITWSKGETIMVPSSTANKMFNHPDVWVKGEGEPEEVPVAEPVVEEEEDTGEYEDAETAKMAVDQMERDAMFDFAKKHFYNVNINSRIGDENLRKKIHGMIDLYGLE